jgi:hypothetical protein
MRMLISRQNNPTADDGSFSQSKSDESQSNPKSP